MTAHVPIDGEDETPLTLYTFTMWVCRMGTIGGVFWTLLEWFA